MFIFWDVRVFPHWRLEFIKKRKLHVLQRLCLGPGELAEEVLVDLPERTAALYRERGMAR